MDALTGGLCSAPRKGNTAPLVLLLRVVEERTSARLSLQTEAVPVGRGHGRTGSGYDPQDVKVIFNPVTYVVFDGMSQRKLKNIQLLARPPQNGGMERPHTSIEQAVKRGNVEFRTLRVDTQGRIS